MVRSVFEAAAAVHPKMHSPMSRAIYGIDVMLDGSFQPKLLEVCELHPFIFLHGAFLVPVLIMRWVPHGVGHVLPRLYESMQVRYESNRRKRRRNNQRP